MQLAAMSKTSILIAPGGGISAVLMFLQPGATAIVLNYWQPDLGTSIQLDAHNFRNIEHLDLQVRTAAPVQPPLPSLGIHILLLDGQ